MNEEVVKKQKPKASEVKEPETKAPEVKEPEVKEPEVKASEAKEPKPVSFCLLTCNSFTQGIKSGVIIKGEKSIVTIDPSDKDYELKVEFMRKSTSNKANGGTKFIELDEGANVSDNECLLDSLLDLKFESLLKIVEGSDVRDQSLSRGALITKIMKQKGAL